MSAVISHASQVQVETNIAQLTWTIVTGPKIYVDIQYKNKTTISNIDSQSLDPQTGPGADLATGVIWVQAGKAVSSIPFERVDISYSHS